MSWAKVDDQLPSSDKFRGLVDEGVTGERAFMQRQVAKGCWAAAALG